MAADPPPPAAHPARRRAHEARLDPLPVDLLLRVAPDDVVLVAAAEPARLDAVVRAREAVHRGVSHDGLAASHALTFAGDPQHGDGQSL